MYTAHVGGTGEFSNLYFLIIGVAKTQYPNDEDNFLNAFFHSDRLEIRYEGIFRIFSL